jgi:hypothetical protein
VLGDITEDNIFILEVSELRFSFDDESEISVPQNISKAENTAVYQCSALISIIRGTECILNPWNAIMANNLGLQFQQDQKLCHQYSHTETIYKSLINKIC